MSAAGLMVVDDDAGATVPAAGFEGQMQFEAGGSVEEVDDDDVADLVQAVVEAGAVEMQAVGEGLMLSPWS